MVFFKSVETFFQIGPKSHKFGFPFVLLRERAKTVSREPRRKNPHGHMFSSGLPGEYREPVNLPDAVINRQTADSDTVAVNEDVAAQITGETEYAVG